MTVESLKRDARRHEQREEWVKALDLYLQAIEHQEMEDEPDIALHNRVGDIQVRVGDMEGAMANYERAIDLYVAAELPNNAIAICRKIVRHEPERPEPYLRMGQIRAAQGFAVDARENFIAYAEMMQARGESDEALRSLRELVDLAPEDVDTRVFVAQLLAARGDSDDALGYLVEAYRVSEAQGLDESQSILVRIREIDPDHPVPTTEGDAEAPSEEDALMDEAFDGYGLSVEEPTVVEGDAEPSSEDGDAFVLDTGPADLDVDAPADWSSSGLDLEGFGTDEEEDDSDEPSLGTPSGVDESWLLSADDSDETEEVVSAETDEEESGWEEPITWEGSGLDDDGMSGVADDLVLDSGLVEPPASTESEAAVDEDSAAGSADSGEEADDTFDLSGLGLEGEEDESEEPDLPYLHFDPDTFETLQGDEGDVEGSNTDSAAGSEPDTLATPRGADDPVGALRAHLEEAPDDADGWRRLGDALFGKGDSEGGRDALETAHRLYADHGEPEKGVRVIRELLIHEPTRIELRQRAVEYAHRSNERTLLVEAFLELADGLRAAGETEKASAVLEQVLEIEPGNLRANEGIAASGGAAATTAASDEYVDLGAMVLDEEGERTTRWTVPAEEPTGDEEADFAKMLLQFKEKVAENISSDDAQSHYDLGAAYKDMGLIQEAVGEFQQALRAQPNHLATFEMLGECFLEMGDADVAIRTLERGLTLQTDVEDDLLGIYYWLAKANEGVGKREAAREYYERIFSLDINFKDVVERLNALR